MSEDRKAEEIEEILNYYSAGSKPASQETIVEMLRELQEANGFISQGLKEQAAGTAGVKLSTIQAIMKRYKTLKEADFCHEIIVCTGRTCAGKGNFDILNSLKEALEIGGSGISGDGKIYLRTRACLKKCRMAPNVIVDGHMYSGNTVEEILRLLGREKG